MSPSEPRRVVARASSNLPVPANALRSALGDLLRALAEQGAAPADIQSIRLTARDPQAFHLSRREMDLAWRESLGGLQRPLFHHAGECVLQLEAIADVQPPRAFAPLYRGMTLPDLARAYSPRLQANMSEVFATWNADGAAFRKAQGGLDIAYGPTRDETLDFYPAMRRDAPLWVFLHGGYWQACSKDQHGQFAEGMLRNGFAVANVDYGLSPQTCLSDIVTQVRHALQFLVAQADALGFDPRRIHLAGHSAGAHLAAMAASDPFGPPVASALLLSGVFDLEPIFHLPMGRMIGLDSGTWRALSPLYRERPRCRIGLALGDLETDEFKRQSTEMAAHCGAPAPLHAHKRHHFNLLEDLRADGSLLALALETASGTV